MTRNSLSVKIVVAAHKEYNMPEDKIYLPLYVGAEKNTDIKLSYKKDNNGDNISSYNPRFCELRDLYWAWKNLDVDYLGIVHYRRYFSTKRNKDKWQSVLSYDDIKPFLKTVKIFVPRKRKYYIETLYRHYSYTFFANQLDATRTIISEKYPDYFMSYDRVVKHRYGYMFNMMIMKKELIDDYCNWIFDILFTLHKRIDTSELSKFQARFRGRISELIFNVWLDYQLESSKVNPNEIKKLQYIYMEKVNWWEKGLAFLKAKFFKKKYEGSFDRI